MVNKMIKTVLAGGVLAVAMAGTAQASAVDGSAWMQAHNERLAAAAAPVTGNENPLVESAWAQAHHSLTKAMGVKPYDVYKSADYSWAPDSEPQVAYLAK